MKPVGECVLKDGGGWEFPPGTTYMPKAAVPEVLGRPGSRGDDLLRKDRGLFPKHHVYKLKDAKGDIVMMI